MNENRKPAKCAITIAEVLSFLPVADANLAHLREVKRQLSEAIKNEFSDQSFLQTLYAKKAEAEKQVVEDLKKLELYRCWAKEEIDRCFKNHDLLIAQREKLHMEEPKKHFSEAIAKLAVLYKRLISLLEKVEEMFIKAQEAFCEAAQKQFPGKIPNKDKYPSPQAPAFELFSKSVSSDIDDDLGKMLRKGPRH
jgi:hypothetical protein